MKLRSEHHFGAFHIRINWLVAAAVMMTCLALGRLGIWQLDRAAEKVEAQQELQSQLQQSATAIEDIPAGHLHPANPEMQNRHVSLKGEYENEDTILLLAEFFDTQIGYGVVTPFRVATTGQLVLVHRGWVSGILPAGAELDVRPVFGPVDVTAQVYVPPANARVFATEIDPSERPIRLRSLEFPVLEEVLGESLFPFEVRLTEDQPGVLVRHWPAVAVDVNQNLSYAVQWFGFAFMVLFASILASSNLWAILKGTE